MGLVAFSIPGVSCLQVPDCLKSWAPAGQDTCPGHSGSVADLLAADRLEGDFGAGFLVV